jgi:heterogeneous nuclear ribonucleoprotein L
LNLINLISAFFYDLTEPSLLGSGGTGFPFVASPEFTPTNGTVSVPSVPGTPTTPVITAESWKTASTGPQSLMKEPPIAVANRNATTQFATQGQQQAAVMMVYGLDNATANTDKLFNLVCLYGKLKHRRQSRKLSICFADTQSRK